MSQDQELHGNMSNTERLMRDRAKDEIFKKEFNAAVDRYLAQKKNINFYVD